MEDGNRLRIVLCLVLGLSGLLLVNTDDPCRSYTDCPSCLYENVTLECGWCLEKNETTNQLELVCVTANSAGSGPEEGSCLEWNYYSCSDSKCLKEGTNCSTCTANSDCSWCDQTVCVASYNASSPSAKKHLYLLSSDDSSSSLHPLCDSITSDPESCFLSLPCSSFNSCRSCTDQAHCGWCNSTSTCIFSLVPHSPSCSNDSFYFSDCPVPLVCSEFEDCFSCNANDPDCRWCSPENSISSGSCLNLATDQCSVPLSFQNCSFPAQINYCELDSSVAFNSCALCTAQNISGYLSPGEAIQGCGFCDGQCYPGNETGPIFATNSTQCNPNNWIFHPSKCEIEQNKTSKNCTMQTNCIDCLQAEQCGWCSPSRGNGTCMNKTTGRCPSVYWFAVSCPYDSQCGELVTCLDCTDFDCYWCRTGTGGKGMCSETKMSPSCEKEQKVCTSEASPSPTPSYNNPKGDGVKGSVIALIVCGCVGFVVLLAGSFVGYWAYKRYRSRRDSYEILR